MNLLSFLSLCALASAGHVKLDFVKSSQPTDSSIGFISDDLVENAVKNLYIINLSIGTPPQNFSLQLDTGSTDLWVPAANTTACKRQSGGCPGGSFDLTQSSTFTLLDTDKFLISYGDGTADGGDYFTDVLQIGDVTVNNMTMGLATATQDGPQLVNDGRGLLGIGYRNGESIVGIENPGQQDGVPTIYDLLVSQGVIDRSAYSLYLNDQDAGTGSIIFGGIDTTKYTGDLVSLPVQISADAPEQRVLVALTGIAVNDNNGSRLLTEPNYQMAALLDSGNSQQSLPDDVYTAISNGLEMDNLGYVPCSYRDSNTSISYIFGGDGGPNVTVSLHELIAATDGTTFPDGDLACMLQISGGGNANGDLSLGDTFLRSAYVVYDIDNNEIAIAQGVLNATSTSNIVVIPSGTGLPGVSSTATLLLPSPASASAATSAPPDATNSAAAATTLQNPSSATFALGLSTASPSQASKSFGSAASSRAVIAGTCVLVTFLGCAAIFA